MTYPVSRLTAEIDGSARAAHAFIIEGRAGEARGAFIRDLAAGLECSADAALRPCGFCPACRQAAAGTSMDIIRMRMSQGSGKQGRASYKTDDASAFIERLGMGSYGRHLVGIIDDADSMSETVQNKLLKTLEEPGAGTIILLAAADVDSLLPTVRSRCSVIRLADYTGEEDEEAAPEKLISLRDLMFSDGSAFHEFRAACEKEIKTAEDALIFLDIAEDECASALGSEPESMSRRISLIAEARMDIRRDMAPLKALKRLYLELR